METSAKDNINIDEAFMEMAREILQRLPGDVYHLHLF